MSTIKLNVPYLVGDQIRNPGEEVEMTDEGRVAFALGMHHAEEVTPPVTRGGKHSDDPLTALEAKKAAEAKEAAEAKDKPMGIFGKPQSEHHDDKKGK